MDGVTLLHQACLHGHRKLVELLIEHNANINAITTNDWLTPLHYVCQYNHKDVRLSVCTCVYQLCSGNLRPFETHCIVVKSNFPFEILVLSSMLDILLPETYKEWLFQRQNHTTPAVTVQLIGYRQNFLSVHHCVQYVASHDPINYRLYYCYWRTMLNWILKMSTLILRYISVAIMATWSLLPYWWLWVKWWGDRW